MDIATPQNQEQPPPVPPPIQYPAAFVSGNNRTIEDHIKQAYAIGGRRVGVVKWYNDNKNYGFLVDLDLAEDVFVHMNDIMCRTPFAHCALYTGEYVEYTYALNDRGMCRAECVTGIRGGPLMCDHGTITFRTYSRRHFHRPQPEQQQEPGDVQVLSTAEAVDTVGHLLEI